MKFTSTRSSISVSAAQAIAQGIADDGGLFVPQSFPVFTSGDIDAMLEMDYRQRACAVLSRYLTDYTVEELNDAVTGAYTGTFENDCPAPLHTLSRDTHFLELWHGPTCAFKDMALQLLPRLLVQAVRKTEPGKTVVILVATSGDTGKAALDGFADVPHTRIIVFYPCDGVSPMQKLQMTTQTGANVAVCAIKGNFDDAQTGVKKIFAAPEMKRFLQQHQMEFSSANSINFGRLVPQIVYYVSAYCELLKNGIISRGETFNAAVPTGNFGNILAAYYARQMGIPVGRLICASNRNNVLTDFIRSGIYDRNRAFYCTTSPSMDILISSNLERLLYELYDHDTGCVCARMKELRETGRYAVEPEILKKLQNDFYGGFCDDREAALTIHELFRKERYLCDPHTAVAANVLQKYRRESGDAGVSIIASTASPFKFAGSVLRALGVSGSGKESETALLERLAEISGMPVPAPLAGLAQRPILHKTCTEKDGMADFIRTVLQ